MRSRYDALCKYHFLYVPAHLAAGEARNRLRRLLFDFGWLQAKFEATDVNSLIADYDLLDGGDTRQVQHAIRLSAHVLATDHAQLAGQLLGRLLGHDSTDIQRLLAEARSFHGSPALLPLHRTLLPPGHALMRTLEGHTGPVRAVAMIPGTNRAVSASWDMTLRVWDLETGAVLHIVENMARLPRGLAVFADGRRALAASFADELVLIDLKSGKVIKSIGQHTTFLELAPEAPEHYKRRRNVRWDISAVVTMPDKRHVLWAAGSGADATLQVSDLQGEEKPRTIATPGARINAIAITPDGRRAALGMDDGSVRVWDLATATEEYCLMGHEQTVNAVAVTSDGVKAVTASDDKTLRVWDLESGTLLHKLQGHSRYVNAVTVFPGDQTVLSGAGDCTLRLWDLKTGQLLRVFTAHTGSVPCVAITPDGRRAISGSSDNTLRLWDLTREVSAPVCGDRVRIPRSLAFDGDGQQLVSVSFDHCVAVRRADTLETVATPDVPDRALAVMPDGRHVISLTTVNELEIWDSTCRAVRTKLTCGPHQLWDAAIAPDGTRVVAATHDGMILTWDVASGELLHVVKAHKPMIRELAVARGGQFAISTAPQYAEPNTPAIWDLSNGRLVCLLVGHDPKCDVMDLAVTPDGEHVVTAASDSMLKVWRIPDGVELRTFQGHTQWVRGVAVSPDGRHVISASYDKTVRVWCFSTGQELARFTCETDLCRCAISQDGFLVAVADNDGQLHVFRLVGLE